MKREQTVWVRNNGAETHYDRYDGEDFAIKPNGYIEITADCARLCFGMGETDHLRALRRLGWAFTTDALAKGEARLAEFSFHMKEQEAREFDPTRAKRTGPSAPAGGGETPGGENPSGASSKGGRNAIDNLARASSHAAG